MDSGFVYILINDSYNGLIKIGVTEINAEERAKQLSRNTGVPTPFRVAYEVYVDDCKVIERTIHNRLDEFRVHPNREFFRYPLNKAIKLIQSLAGEKDHGQSKYEALEILPELTSNFGEYIDPTISSVRVYQTEDRVYLEITRDKYIRGDLKDQYITRTDTGFIGDPLLDPKVSININANEILSLDPYSIINCFDLFTKEACEKVAREHLEERPN